MKSLFLTQIVGNAEGGKQHLHVNVGDIRGEGVRSDAVSLFFCIALQAGGARLNL